MLASRRLRPPRRPVLARAFHASCPRHHARDALLSTLLYLPHELLSLVHAAVPWYAALPASALLVRGLLVTTAGTAARALTARYVGLHPLRQAIAFQKRDQLMRDAAFTDPKHARSSAARHVKHATRALDARWKCTLAGQLSWTLAQIPIFLTMAEVIRQMCGTRDGLLAMALRAVGWRSPATSPPESPHAAAAALPNPWFESSLSDEGMLWFTDLLVPDPTGTLPFVVSGLMFANVYLSKNGAANAEQMPRTTRIIRRSLLGLSLLVGPMCQSIPAALMLYWAGSTSSVMLWNLWLDWRHPSPRGFMACKRPVILLPTPSTVRGRRRV